MTETTASAQLMNVTVERMRRLGANRDGSPSGDQLVQVDLRGNGWFDEKWYYDHSLPCFARVVQGVAELYIERIEALLLARERNPTGDVARLLTREPDHDGMWADLQSDPMTDGDAARIVENTIDTLIEYGNGLTPDDLDDCLYWMLQMRNKWMTSKVKMM